MDPQPKLSITPVTPEREQEKKERAVRKIKIVVLGGAMTAASVFSALYFASFLEGLRGSDLWASVGSAGLSILCLVLVVLFVKKTAGQFFWISLAALLPPLAVLFAHRPAGTAFTEHMPVALAGGGLFLCFMFLGTRRSAEIIKNSIEIKFFPTVKPLVPKAITGVLAFFSVLFYLSYFSWGRFNEEFLKTWSITLMQSADPVIQAWLDDRTISAGSSMDEVIGKIAEGQVTRQLREVAGEDKAGVQAPAIISEEDRRELVGGFQEELTRMLEDISGPIQSGETAGEVIYRIGKQYIVNLLAQLNVTPYAGVALTFVVFFLMKSLSFGVGWILEAVALVVYKILMAMHFARMVYTDVKKEEIEL